MKALQKKKQATSEHTTTPSFQNLPDELWIHVILAGVKRSVLDHRDLCSLSIVCRRLARLSSLDCAWGVLLSRHYCISAATSKQQERNQDCKLRFRSRFEKNKAVMMTAHKRRILRVQSQVTVLVNECHHYEHLITDEQQKLLATAKKLRDAELARRSSVALKVWQPQMIRTKQEQVLEQQSTDFNFFKHDLQMEVCVCKERIERFSKSLKSKKQMLEKTRGELEALTYHPIQDHQVDLKASDMQSFVKKKVREEKLSLNSRSQEAVKFSSKP